jgi:putative endonuclease
MPSPKRARGDEFEALASKHLTRAGLEPIGRNALTRFGEIDLVMRDETTIVFVEVRYRRTGAFGGAIGSIDARKQRKLAIAAAQFLQRSPHLMKQPCRFDVVAITGAAEPYRIDWIRDAFRLA